MGLDLFVKKYLRCGLLQQHRTLTHHSSQSQHPNILCYSQQNKFELHIFAGPAANCHPKQFFAIPSYNMLLIFITSRFSISGRAFTMVKSDSAT